MTTSQLIDSFLKGNTVAVITEKQRNYLLRLAGKADVVMHNDGFNQYLYYATCHYAIRHCKQLASGGSYVGKKIVQGKYRIEKMYTIKFDRTSLTQVCKETDLKHYEREGHAYTIINQL